MNTKLDDIFKSNYNTQTSTLNADDVDSLLETSVLLAKSTVPYSHRRIANNYTIMKRIYPFLIAQPRITSTETNLLKKYHFNTLENTSIKTSNNEIMLLKELATSTDDTTRDDAFDLLQIRIKELKYIMSNNYTLKTNEMLKGYKAIETYLVNITKYYS